jgi:hypothetical protein
VSGSPCCRSNEARYGPLDGGASAPQQQHQTFGNGNTLQVTIPQPPASGVSTSESSPY